MDDYPRLEIVTDNDESKGRTFQAALVGMLESDRTWDNKPQNSIRPVWMSFAASTGEIGPFLANVRMGKKIRSYHSSFRGDQMDLLKSAGFEYITQRMSNGTVAVTAYLPDLFRMNPGMVDPERIQFILLPPLSWVRDTRLPEADVRAASEHVFRMFPKGVVGKAALMTMAPLASLFCAYLDRRTELPIINDLRFHLQIFMGALHEGLANFPTPGDRWRRDEDVFQNDSGYKEWGMTNASVAHGRFREDLNTTVIAPQFIAKHDTFKRFLVTQTLAYYDAIGEKPEASFKLG